jgi:ABC-type antimicrobial peptide transport system ATPase subunit
MLEVVPFTSARHISERMNESRDAILRSLMNEMKREKLIFKWVSYIVSDKNKIKCARIDSERLEVLEQSPKKRKNLVMGDDNWIYWSTPLDSQSLAEGSARPSISKIVMESKKMMVFVVFSLREFLAVKLLSDRVPLDSHFMIYDIFSEINNKIAETRQEMRIEHLDLHIYTAPANNSRQTGDAFNWVDLKEILHPCLLDLFLATFGPLISSRVG